MINNNGFEFATFKVKQGVSKEQVISAFSLLYQHYLSKQKGFIAHRLWQNSDGLWADNMLTVTQQDAINICQGWSHDPYCQQALALMDPESTQISFWSKVNTSPEAIIEIVTWQSKPDTSDELMIERNAALLPDLQQLPGFISKKLYKSGPNWLDIYYWRSQQDAENSNQLMAEKTCFQEFIQLVESKTIQITLLEEV